MRKHVRGDVETGVRGVTLGIHHNLYAVIQWWPSVKFKSSKAEYSKLQKLTCLGIIAAMRPTEVLFELPPLHLKLEAETRTGIYSLLLQWAMEDKIRKAWVLHEFNFLSYNFYLEMFIPYMIKTSVYTV
jgi:hypothetical protein